MHRNNGERDWRAALAVSLVALVVALAFPAAAVPVGLLAGVLVGLNVL